MQVQILSADYVAAVRLRIQPRKVYRIIGVAIVVLSVVVAALVVATSRDGEGMLSVFLTLGGLGYLAMWYWLILPWRVKRIFSQQKSLQEPFSMDIEENGLRFKNQLGEALMPWGHVHHWKESSSLFLLFQSEALMHIIPKRAFSSPDEVEAFRLTLLRQVGAANIALQATRVNARA